MKFIDKANELKIEFEDIDDVYARRLARAKFEEIICMLQLIADTRGK